MEATCYESRYADLVADILHNGIERQTRNAVTKSVFGRTLKVDMEAGEFPLLRGRTMYYKGVVGELAALLRGPKTLADFEKFGCNYWKQWAKPDGTIEVDYGNAWLDFNGVNQLDELVAGLRADPYGRRHIVTGWRPDRLKELSLPCCHLLYQWYVRDGKLDMIWYQRSVDTMIGLPSDVVLAYVWNTLVANDAGLVPGEITMMLGDTHIYAPHYEGAQEYVDRVGGGLPAYPTHAPIVGGMKDFDPASIQVEGYHPVGKLYFDLIA